MSQPPLRRPARSKIRPVPGRLPPSTRARIERRLRARHGQSLRDYLALVAFSSDSPQLEDLARRTGEIEIALDRLQRDEYGICLGCGRPIGERRLVAAPLADRCARCEASAAPL